jgi:hypothetical protein
MNGEQADGNSLAPQVQGPAGTQTHRPSEMGPEDILDRLEERAMSTMTKGYFRHVGNIRFESAMANPDHWESWFLWRDEVVYHFEQEKADYPEWIQPKVSIMAVKYGLKTIGDYSREVHFQGDYNDEIVAGEEINSDADSQ